MKNNPVRFEKQSPSVEQSHVETWLTENEPKLRQYARALATRDTSGLYDADDFFQAACMKIFLLANEDAEFLARGNGYIFKTAWNEGLMMIRKQRRYAMLVGSAGVTDEDVDAMESVPAPESDNPELQVIAKHLTQDEQELVRLAIASLPENSREIVQMLYAGKRPVDVARHFGWKGQQSIPTYYMNQIRDAFRQFGLQAI